MKKPSTFYTDPEGETPPENRPGIWFAALVTASLPALLTWLLVRFWLHADISRYVPSTWNDMTDYWHETLSFLRAGFQSGLYGVNELGVAPISALHFDAHGPFYAVLYGSLAWFTGWDYPTAIYFNMAFLAVGVLVFVLLVKPNYLQILATALVMLVVFPVLMYVPTNSQEPFHQMGAFIAAGIFYHLIRSRRAGAQEKPGRGFVIASLCFFLFMMSVRLSWGLFLLPFFSLLSERNWKAQLRALGVTLVCLAFGYAVMWAVSPPQGNNHTVMLIMQGFKTSPREGLRVIETLVNYNVLYAREWSRTVNVLLFAECTLLVLVLIGWLWREKGADLRDYLRRGAGDELLFHLYNLITVLVMTFTVYLVENAARVLGVHLLISLLLMVCFHRKRFLSAVVLLNLLLMPWYLQDYRTSWQGNFDKDPQTLALLRLEVTQRAGYRDDYRNPWCNTMLIPLDLYDYRATVIPAGLGIQFYLRRMPLEVPLKSHYLLMDEKNLTVLEDNIGELPLEPLYTLPFGTVYRNMDADCEPHS